MMDIQLYTEMRDEAERRVSEIERILEGSDISDGERADLQCELDRLNGHLVNMWNEYGELEAAVAN